MIATSLRCKFSPSLINLPRSAFELNTTSSAGKDSVVIHSPPLRFPLYRALISGLHTWRVLHNPWHDRCRHRFNVRTLLPDCLSILQG